MKRYIRLLCVALMLIFVGCGDDNTTDETPLKLVSQSVSDNQSVDILSTSSFTFSENITLYSGQTMTLNAIPVTASVSGATLTINATLERNQSYTLRVPSGSVIGGNGRVNSFIKISFTAVSTSTLKQSLTTPNPSTQAVNLYNLLLENYGKKTISGAHASDSWNTNEADWIYKHTGKYPALTCVDYGHLQSSVAGASWIDYSQISFLESWWNSNGIVAANWHWNVPKSGQSGDMAFYTSDTSFDISQAVVSGTWQNTLILKDIDDLADYLKLLQQKNIPILWRPLHEAAGGWFWWGAKGADAYVKMWQLLYDRLVNTHGLNNLIWVWTTEGGDAQWYPGDAYVDIVGRDMYNKTDVTTCLGEFNTAQNSYTNCMVALSECGDVAQIPSQWEQGATWSWFMPWYDYDRTNDKTSTEFDKTTPHKHADIAWWQSAFAQSYVLTRDQMPSLK